jgi:hypothetical protein
VPGFAREVAASVMRQLDRPLLFAGKAALLSIAAALLLDVAGSPLLRPASTTVTPACAPVALTVSVGAGGGAAGSMYYPLVFRDTSAHSCTLRGYPGVSFIWRDGAQVGAVPSRDPSVAVSVVTLRPGGKARALLRVADAAVWPAALCVPVPVHRLRVYPPGSYGSVVVAFSTVTCSRKVPPALGSPLSVTAVAGSLP